jgi:hypothetical protein
MKSLLDTVAQWLGLVLGQVSIWVAFAMTSSKQPESIFGVLLLVSFTLMWITATVWLARRDDTHLLVLGFAAVNTVIFLVAYFATFYLSYGTRTNWNMRLTHLDALMVALGTLTTAGTGDIQPRSETARTLLTGQMAIDLVVVTVMSAFVLNRFVARRKPSHSIPD